MAARQLASSRHQRPGGSAKMRAENRPITHGAGPVLDQLVQVPHLDPLSPGRTGGRSFEGLLAWSRERPPRLGGWVRCHLVEVGLKIGSAVLKEGKEKVPVKENRVVADVRPPNLGLHLRPHGRVELQVELPLMRQ